ncbi:glycosyltransferase [Oceanirhabdus sp. W0125-5]|uniref:glycosyltransferase n=1 Tax=Oceanirhabdus sp. W0125-5 TaxID=2999116 RepID=UPI0022F2C270|nr:glycosyltransferase [Oceanirhabdus sp. W0125-5]WBW99445.1 glycosyltransferase [Oceanirhabdus sp. W0125-5]
MKVLIISSWYPNKNSTINGVFVKEQAKALKDAGINPIVFYPYDDCVQKGEIISCEEEGVLTYRANTSYLRNSKLALLVSIKMSIVFMKKIVKDHSIDIIHSHVCYPTGFIAAVYNKFYKTPFILTEHMSKVREFALKPYNNVLFKYAYNKAQKVLTVSTALLNELKQLGFKFNGEVMGNVVDVSEYSINNNRVYDNKFKIAFIGSLFEVKGLRYFIPALASFLDENKDYDVEFNIYGDGNQREELEELSRKLNLNHICKFHGRVKKNEIPKKISENNFLVLPSIKETFGSVLIEAMAGGKPVLTTKCGGPQDFVDETRGVLVNPKSIEHLKEGLCNIIETYNEFDNQKIRDFVKENYSYEAIGKKLIEKYQEVLYN